MVLRDSDGAFPLRIAGELSLTCGKGVVNAGDR